MLYVTCFEVSKQLGFPVTPHSPRRGGLRRRRTTAAGLSGSATYASGQSPGVIGSTSPDAIESVLPGATGSTVGATGISAARPQTEYPTHQPALDLQLPEPPALCRRSMSPRCSYRNSSAASSSTAIAIAIGVGSLLLSPLVVSVGSRAPVEHVQQRQRRFLLCLLFPLLALLTHFVLGASRSIASRSQGERTRRQRTYLP